MMYAISSGAGNTNPLAGAAAIAGSSTSTTGNSAPNRPATRGAHPTTGAASDSTKDTRASGCAGSIGR